MFQFPPKFRPIGLVAAAAVALAAPVAQADIAIAGRAGTLGVGAEIFKGFTDTFSVRLGYGAFSHDQTVDDTDAIYDGTLKLGNLSLLADWHILGKGFHLSAGLVQTDNRIDLSGVPTGGTFDLGGTTYPATSISSVSGAIKVGNSSAPYVGFGFGNAISDSGRVTFLFDVGVITTGTPSVSLNVVCAAAVPAATCTQIQASAQTEVNELRTDATTLKLWPVINFGVAFRF